MKATKKIICTACAFAVAATLSVGSTFAWFASNSHVSATNMLVQATVPTNIYIEKEYKQSATEVTQEEIEFIETGLIKLTPAVMATKKLESGGIVPVEDGGVKGGGAISSGGIYLYTSPDITETEKWDTLPGENIVGVPKELTEVANGKFGADSFQWIANGDLQAADYVATYDMTLANKSLETDILAKVSVTAKSTETCFFVRTGMLVGIQSAAGGDMSYKYFSIANVSGADTMALNEKGGTFDYGAIIEDMPQNTVATITFFIWFDGQDDDCKVHNASNLKEIEFSIEFTTPGGPAE